MHGHRSEGNMHEPQRPPRRMKSLSDALDSLGSSFHNIYEKHIHHHHHKHSKDTSTSHSSSSSNCSDHLKGKSDEDDHHQVNNNVSVKELPSVVNTRPLENGTNGHHNRHNNMKKQTSNKKVSSLLVNGVNSAYIADNFKLDPDPSPSGTKKPFDYRVKNSPTGSPQATKKDKRSSSIIWVDFLTQGANDDNTYEIEDKYESSDDDEHELDAISRDKSPMSRATSPRKIWFDKITHPDSEGDGELATKKSEKTKKLRRRDSMAPSVPKVKSPEP